MELKDSEIPTKGSKAQLAYERALKDGYVKVYRGRIILLGQDRAGKTSLKRSLLGLPFDPKEQSTEGIEMDPSKCEIHVDQAVGNWQFIGENKPLLLQCSKDVAKIVADEMIAQERIFMPDKSLEEKNLLERFGEDSEEEDTEESLGEKDTDKKVEGKGDYPSVDAFHDSSNEDSMHCLLNEPDVVIDLTQPPDTVKHVHQWLEYVQGKPIKSASFTEESSITMDIWDFAGQHLYYASHPMFVSQRALYILVHNLSKPLDAPAEPCIRQGSNDVKLENPNNETNMENLLSWLATVHSVAQATDDTDNDAQHKLPYLRPPVFIVGTHADKPVKDITVIKKQIKERISGMEYGKHVITPLFCIDNTKSKRPNLIEKFIKKIGKQRGKHKTEQEGKVDGINELQNTILEVLRQEPYMGEKIPVRWFLFEKVIEALVAKQIYHRNLKQLEHYARRDCFMEDEKEFVSMISFYHGLGLIIKHRNTVVLKAQWLIDLFKQLITIPPFNKQNPLCAKYWQELEGSGILSMEYIDYVFSSFIEQGVIKEDILDMMEQFGLVAKFSVSPTDVKYFVPAQLKSLPDKLCEMKPSSADLCPLYLLFVHGSVPHGLFLQLVSRSIRWCSKTWPTYQPTLYQNGAWFIIGKDIHDFVLICKTGFVKVILRQRTQSHQVVGENSAKLATVVREFIEDTLQNLSQEMPYLRGLQYRLCVACPYCHQGAEDRACSDHVKTTCTHMECFHLIDANEGQAEICKRNVEDIVLHPGGLEKWFLKRRRQGLSSSNEAARSHGSLDRMIQIPQQMQIDASKVKRRRDLSLGLRKIASDEDFRMSDNEGLGNCMFYALSEQLEIVKGIKIPHGRLRQTLVNYIRANPTLPDGTDLFHFVHGHQTWTEYLTHMEQDGTWGDHVILYAAANSYKTCIRVVSNLSHSNAVIITPHCPVDESKPLVLGHIDELHYVSLQPIQAFRTADHAKPQETHKGATPGNPREEDNSLEVEEVSRSTDQDDEQLEEAAGNENGGKTVIRRGKIAGECQTWNFAEAGASITFKLGTIAKSLAVTCSLWSPEALSLPIGKDELLVSNVIELSHDGAPDLEFMENVPGRINVALSHSAFNLKGYEVVIKQLVDPEYNEWKDLETTNIWHTSVSAIVPNWMFPFAEATCTKRWFSSFAVIWRLRSFVFPKLTSVTTDFICSVPDYSNVSVAIPWNSLPADADFCLTLKVQEAPRIDRDVEGMFVGPILHISCSHDVKLSEPAKISVPLALTDSEKEPVDLQSGQLRILHFKSRENSQEWTDITDHLEMPVVLRDGIVTFQVKAFCRFWPWLLKTASVPWNYVSFLYNRTMKRRAGFLACLCDDAVPSRNSLIFSCFPQHLMFTEVKDISSLHTVSMQGYGTSWVPLSNEDKIFVSLSEGFEVREQESTEGIVLTFLDQEPFRLCVRVSIGDKSNLQVKFCKEREKSGVICAVPIIPRSAATASVPATLDFEEGNGMSAQIAQQSGVKRPNVESWSGSPDAAKKRKRSCVEIENAHYMVKDGNPSEDELEVLSLELGEKWEELGRRLGFKQAEIISFYGDNRGLSRRAYLMLLAWKQKEGSKATYAFLNDVLCHNLVKRKDLGEQFCCDKIVDNASP